MLVASAVCAPEQELDAQVARVSRVGGDVSYRRAAMTKAGTTSAQHAARARATFFLRARRRPRRSRSGKRHRHPRGRRDGSPARQQLGEVARLGLRSGVMDLSVRSFPFRHYARARRAHGSRNHPETEPLPRGRRQARHEVLGPSKARSRPVDGSRSTCTRESLGSRTPDPPSLRPASKARRRSTAGPTTATRDGSAPRARCVVNSDVVGYEIWTTTARGVTAVG